MVGAGGARLWATCATVTLTVLLGMLGWVELTGRGHRHGHASQQFPQPRETPWSSLVQPSRPLTSTTVTVARIDSPAPGSAVREVVRFLRQVGVFDHATVGECCAARGNDLGSGRGQPRDASGKDVPGSAGSRPLPSLTSRGLPRPTTCTFMQPHTVLLFSPPMVRAQRPPCLELDLWFGDASSTTAGATSSTRAVRPHPPPTRTARPEFSLVVNVFNHASTIERVLRQALKLTTEAAELIVFFDGCTDRSVEVANALIERYARGWPACKSDAEAADPRTECTARAGDTVEATARSRVDLGHVRFIVQPANNSVFETSGNNIAMRAAVGKYIVIMQDDMYLTEYGWNTRLAAAPRQYSDVLSVSAMCAHTLHPLGADKVGPCGALAAHARRMSTASAATRNTFHLRPTSNRGPLLIDADKLAEIGYLDEWNYRIFNDDHDLHCRAALDRGWVTGHVPIGFTLNLSEGGVRINKKRQKPAYEIEFIAARNARYNRRDCFRARKKEYIEAVKNGSVVTSGARPLGTHL